MSFEQTLSEIDHSLEMMRQNLARGEELLASLNWNWDEPDYDSVTQSYMDEISNDHDRHVGFSQPLEYYMDEDFDVDDDPSVNSRRLSFSSDTTSETVVYFTPFNTTRYLYNIDTDDYDVDSDTETVVGVWEEPWRSPSA